MKLLGLSIFNSRGYVSLDILRGIAAWLVAIPHFFLFTGYKSESLEYLSVLAVEIFFILSGFVLGPQLSLCFKHKTYHNIKTFFLRRWLRTLPIFFIILILFTIFSEKITLGKLIETATFTYNFFSYDKNNTFFLVSWSLAIEEWFYILFPLLGYTLFRKIKIINFILIFILLLMIVKIYFHFFTEINYHRITVLRLDSIALGYLSYLLINNINLVDKRFYYIGLTSNLILFLLGYYFFLEKNLLFFIVVTNLAAILLICLLKLSDNKIKYSQTAKKTSAFFAHTSYCVYLCHSLIILLFFQDITKYGLGLFLYYFISLIFFSIASFYLVEKCFLSLRPQYHKINQNTGYLKYTYYIGANFIVLITLVVLLESVSKTIPKVFISRTSKFVESIEEKQNMNTDENKYDIYTNKDGLNRDFDNYPGDKYISYLTHVPQKYTSEYLNIGQNGIRKNNNKLNSIPKNDEFVIWLVGSSAIFGATNSDNETISANLEILYQNQFPNRKIRVLNLGVQGYNSLQDFLNIKFKLLEEAKPNYILIINGYNDYYTASLAKQKNISIATRTWSNSYNILSNGWYLHTNNQLFNLEILKTSFYSNFSSFLEVVRLGKKWLKYRYYNNNPELFIKNYNYNIIKSNNIFMSNVSIAEKFYLGNIEMIIKMAKYFNIPIGIAQQPTLISTKKKLSNSELEIFNHKKLELFASDISLFEKGTIPTYAIDKKHFINYNNFKEGYRKQKDNLESLAKQEKVIFLDLEKEIDQYDDIPIFTSIVHFTLIGSKKISEFIYNNLNLDPR